MYAEKKRCGSFQSFAGLLSDSFSTRPREMYFPAPLTSAIFASGR